MFPWLYPRLLTKQPKTAACGASVTRITFTTPTTEKILLGVKAEKLLNGVEAEKLFNNVKAETPIGIKIPENLPSMKPENLLSMKPENLPRMKPEFINTSVTSVTTTRTEQKEAISVFKQETKDATDLQQTLRDMQQRLANNEQLLQEIKSEILTLKADFAQLRSAKSTPFISVQEETEYFGQSKPKPIVQYGSKQIQTDAQGQIRLMTPPGSLSSLSSMPSPKCNAFSSSHN